MIQEDEDRQNLAKLRELNHSKVEENTVKLEDQRTLANQAAKVDTHNQHDGHDHDHSQGCEGHDHGAHGHGHGHGGHKHGTPGKKNYFIIFFTIFTTLSSLYLQTQHLNPLIDDKRAQLMSYIAMFYIFMGLWSYIQTMRISSTVQKFQKKEIPYRGLQLRDCQKCNFIKVPRVSHCSTCGKCIYKLDHHCVWTQTCIGYRNQRPFYLFVFYMSINVLQFWYSTIRAASILLGGCHFFGSFEPGVYILWAITCVSVGVIGVMILMLCLAHSLMVSTNYTTLDQIKKKRNCPIPFIQSRPNYLDSINNWDRGEIQNLKSLFGKNFLTFWLPFGREIDNEFLFQKISPIIPAQLCIFKIPPNCSPDAIKERLKGKKLKVQGKELAFDQI